MGKAMSTKLRQWESQWGDFPGGGGKRDVFCFSVCFAFLPYLEISHGNLWVDCLVSSVLMGSSDVLCSWRLSYYIITIYLFDLPLEYEFHEVKDFMSFVTVFSVSSILYTQ